MRDDINRLVKPAAAEKRLPAAKNPPAMRAKTGLERKQADDANVTTETVTVESTDGLFSFDVTVVRP